MKSFVAACVVGLCCFSMLPVAGCSFGSVDTGHVAVPTVFGKPTGTTFSAGLHFPVNPLADWTHLSIRDNTITESLTIPSADEQRTQVDISVQYRLDAEKAVQIVQRVKDEEGVMNVYLVPQLRSVSREVGKSIDRVEDFFQQETHQKLQQEIEERLNASLAPQGVIIDSVLIRDVTLPPYITAAIEQKKVREQQAETQKAELERFRTEQEQKIAQAEAEKEAAAAEAEQIKLLADARAYEIEKVNEAIDGNSAYVQLEALKTLAAISSDPSAKLYFLNGDSPQPLPLMNIDVGPASPPKAKAKANNAAAAAAAVTASK